MRLHTNAIEQLILLRYPSLRTHPLILRYFMIVTITTRSSRCPSRCPQLYRYCTHQPPPLRSNPTNPSRLALDLSLIKSPSRSFPSLSGVAHTNPPSRSPPSPSSLIITLNLCQVLHTWLQRRRIGEIVWEDAMAGTPAGATLSVAGAAVTVVDNRNNDKSSDNGNSNGVRNNISSSGIATATATAASAPAAVSTSPKQLWTTSTTINGERVYYVYP